MSRKPLGIYIHIPFCVQKCLYCDFVSGPGSEHTQIIYVNHVMKEIEYASKQLCPFSNNDDGQQNNFEKYSNKSSDYIVDTVFIGGGTPSVLDGNWIENILCKLKEIFTLSEVCECSIEVNPGTVDFDKLKKYREAGINRLSIGLQSCNDNELTTLGRIHDFNAFKETYRLARAAGFENINVDLMSAIPEQTVESYVNSLRTVAELSPEHISVYSLIVEEGTPFWHMNLQLPDEEEERKIYYETGRILKEYGYEQYEISNYAKAEKECKHNIRYWKCDEYIGFGVAAASYLNGVRWKNTESIEKYLQSGLLKENTSDDKFYCEVEVLTQEEKCAEFIFMGLRMNRGISVEEFEHRFNCILDKKYADVIDKHIRNGLLVKKDNHIMLTERGRDVCNFVMADFLL